MGRCVVGMLTRLLLWCDDRFVSIVCCSLQRYSNGIYGGVNAAFTGYVSIMSTTVDGVSNPATMLR